MDATITNESETAQESTPVPKMPDVETSRRSSDGIATIGAYQALTASAQSRRKH